MSEVRAPSAFILERSVAAWQRAKAALEADATLADDEAVIARALEADPHALAPDEILRRLATAAMWAEVRATEAKALANSLTARSARFHARAATLRAVILDVMDATSRKTFSAPIGTVSIRNVPPAAVILDEEQLEDAYVRIKREAKRREITADLRAGVDVRGAVLSNAGRTLVLTPHGAPAIDFETGEEVE